MVEIMIDAEVCKKDGLCAMTCMRGIIKQDEKGAMPRVIEADVQHCYGCGQCVSICPSGAITHSGFPEGTVTPVRTELLPTYDQVLELMHNRRSKRSFRDKVVEKEMIEKLLEVARFAPSGHNEQSTEFVVIQDREVLKKIGDLTAAGIRKEAMQYTNPIAKTMMRLMIGKRNADYVIKLAPELIGLADLYDSGTDWILRGAPVLILFCADSSAEFFGRVNANLALHNAVLASETLGLGGIYAGFVVLASDRSKDIARLVGLPDTHKIYGALAMGYSSLKFRKWPQRNPAKVSWVGMNGHI